MDLVHFNSEPSIYASCVVHILQVCQHVFSACRPYDQTASFMHLHTQICLFTYAAISLDINAIYTTYLYVRSSSF